MADRPRLYRGLRITASAVCGVVCLLLLCLWGRSYWWRDGVHRRVGNKVIKIDSLPGNIALNTTGSPRFRRHPSETEFAVMESGGNLKIVPVKFGFRWYSSNRGLVISVPHWFLTLAFAGFALTPWLPWRFSLRMLLVAITLVAVGMGIVVYLVRG